MAKNTAAKIWVVIEVNFNKGMKNASLKAAVTNAGEFRFKWEDASLNARLTRGKCTIVSCCKNDFY